MARLVQMKFKERDVRLKDIPKFYEDLSTKKLTIGVHHEQGKHNVEKAVWNEFGKTTILQAPLRKKLADGTYARLKEGTILNTPARPFVRLYLYPERFNKLKQVFVDALDDCFISGLKDYKNKANMVLDMMGYSGKNEMQDIILSQNVLLPNAELTIAIKGFDYPLVREGKLVNAIDYKVRKR